MSSDDDEDEEEDEEREGLVEKRRREQVAALAARPASIKPSRQVCSLTAQVQLEGSRGWHAHVYAPQQSAFPGSVLP